MPTFAYDTAGNLTSVTTPAGRVSAFGYDTAGRVTSVTRYTTLNQHSGDAAVTGFSYAANPDGSGNSVETNPLGQTSTFALDTLGRVTSVTDPLGHTRAQTYTPNSDVATAVDAMGTSQNPGNKATFSYDPATNNLTSATLPTTASTTLQYTGGAGCVSTDTAHPYLPKCVTDPQGHQSTATYTPAGDSLTSTDTTSGTTQTVTRQGVNGANCGAKPGAVCTSTDGKGAVTTYSYNAAGLVSQVSPPGSATVYTYDSLNRLTARQNPNGLVTSYNYANNNFAQEVGSVYNPDYFNFYRHESDNYYDLDGELITEADSNRVGGPGDYYTHNSYTYDALGRQTAATTGTTTSPATQSVVYDKAGNVTSFTDGQGTVAYGYDPGNELVSVSEPGGNCTSTPGTGCTRYGYNANGARTSTTYPGGTVQNTAVDKSGRATRITATGPGANGAGTGTVFSDLGYSYTAGTADRTVVQSRTNTVAVGVPNGSATTYTYDSLGRLTAAADMVGATTNSQFGYGYDQAGNLTQQTLTAPGGATQTTTNAYAADNRLTQVNGSTANVAFDSAGNQVSYPATAPSVGNMAAASPLTTTNYGLAGQAATMNSGGTAVGMQYLGPDQNQRITAGTTTFGTGALGVSTQTTGAATTAFTRTPRGSLVSERTSAGSVYYLTDNQGTVIGLVNNQGQKVAGYAYTPYGQTRTITGTTTGDLTQANTNPYRYTSGYLDPTSNLYKLGYRYYDPTQSRFTQQDPSGQEQNPYLYAGGDPINNADPTGLGFFNDVVGGAAFVGGIAATGVAAPVLGVVGAVSLSVAIGEDIASTQGPSGGTFCEIDHPDHCTTYAN